MWTKILLGVLGLFLVCSLGLFLWVRSVLASDAVQVALAGQLSKALGQPVTIGQVGASIYPRISIALRDISIGQTSQIKVKALDVGTDFRALLSRRIEHAALHVNGTRLELPLPPLTLGSATPAGATEGSGAGSPVEIVSIDEVVLSDIEIVSGGRTLKGHVEAVPEGKGVAIRNITLSADDMSLTATGRIEDLAGPKGEIALKAGGLNIDRLIAFLNDLSGGLSSGGAPAAETPTPSAGSASSLPGALHFAVTIDAERATMGGLTIDRVSGRALAAGNVVTLEPLKFGVFGGTYDGGLTITLGTPEPTFHWKAAVAGMDVAAAAAYAGTPNTITGRLAGAVDISGRGADAAMAMKTMAGTARLDVTNGVVRNLGLVRSVVAATSLNVEGLKQAAVGAKSSDEAFTRLSGTITLANGIGSTENLRFEATGLLLLASGTVRLDASALNFKGQLQLSEALSQQMPRTFVGLSEEKGRVTLPATITGSAAEPIVRVDVRDAGKRALRNAAKEAAPALIKKRLGGLLRK